MSVVSFIYKSFTQSLTPPEKQLNEEGTQVFNFCTHLLIKLYTGVLLLNIPSANLNA